MKAGVGVKRWGLILAFWGILLTTNALYAGDLIVKSNGVVIGQSISFGVFEASLPVVNKNGTHFRISPVDGKIDRSGVFYDKVGCVGKAYANPFWGGHYVFFGREGLFYIPDGSVVKQVVLRSTWSPIYNGCTDFGDETSKNVMATFPNDAKVTGVSSKAFKLPITVNYEK